MKLNDISYFLKKVGKPYSVQTHGLSLEEASLWITIILQPRTEKSEGEHLYLEVYDDEYIATYIRNEGGGIGYGSDDINKVYDWYTANVLGYIECTFDYKTI